MASVAILGLSVALNLQGEASGQFEQVREQRVRIERRCADATEAECLIDLRFLNAAESDLRERYRLAAASQDPIATGALAAGLMASLPGIIILALVAGAHVAEEFASGTAGGRLARDPRTLAFVIAKFSSLWAFGIMVLVFVWLVLALEGTVSRLAMEVSGPPVGFQPRVYAIQQVLRAVIVMGSAAALFVLVGIVSREPIATVAICIVVILTLLVVSISEAACRWSWACWVAKWMAFRREDYAAGSFWVVATGVDIATVRQLVGMVGTGTFALIMSWVVMRRE